MQVCHSTLERMASSAVFFPSCIPKTQNSSLSVPKSHSLSRTMSLLPPQATQKFLSQPLKSKRISPIVVNPKRCYGTVKALKKGQKRFVEVFSEEDLDVSLAHDVHELSKKCIQRTGAFSVVLSDESVKHLRKLVEPPYIRTINWSKWHFFWVEEPVYVPPDYAERGLLNRDVARTNHEPSYDEFLSKVPLPNDELNVWTIEYHLSDEKVAAKSHEKNLRAWVSENVKITSSDHIPKFDLILLGLGPDGRVGSLSPDHPVLNEKEEWVTVLKKKDKTGPARVTLTLPVINSCSNIAMVVAGSATADAVYSALNDDNQQAHRKLPAKLVSPNDGQLKWYLDEGAASKL